MPYAVFGPPAVGRYSSGLTLNGTPVVLIVDPNCTPLLLAWLLIQTNGGGPEKIPAPPRTCNDLSPTTSQLNPKRGETSGRLFGFCPTSYFIPAKLRFAK